MGFSGTFGHGLDPKNRIFIPAEFREALGENFHIFKAPEKCLRLYPHELWVRFSDKMNKKVEDEDTVENRTEARKFFGKVADCKMDKQGRITIGSTQLEYAKIEKDVTIVGMGNYVEIWNCDKWNELMGDE